MGPQGAYLVNFLGSLIFSLDFIDPNHDGLNKKVQNYGKSLSLPQNLKINIFSNPGVARISDFQKFTSMVSDS